MNISDWTVRTVNTDCSKLVIRSWALIPAIQNHAFQIMTLTLSIFLLDRSVSFCSRHSYQPKLSCFLFFLSAKSCKTATFSSTSLSHQPSALAKNIEHVAAHNPSEVLHLYAITWVVIQVYRPVFKTRLYTVLAGRKLQRVQLKNFMHYE